MGVHMGVLLKVQWWVATIIVNNTTLVHSLGRQITPNKLS